MLCYLGLEIILNIVKTSSLKVASKSIAWKLLCLIFQKILIPGREMTKEVPAL